MEKRNGFNVGDRVLIDNPRGHGDGGQGTIVEITQDEVFPYRVQIDDGMECGYAAFELSLTKNYVVTKILNDL